MAEEQKIKLEKTDGFGKAFTTDTYSRFLKAELETAMTKVYKTSEEVSLPVNFSVKDGIVYLNNGNCIVQVAAIKVVQ